MTPAALSQWFLLIGYGALLLYSSFVLINKPRLRPLSFAICFIALTHTVYYVAFLIFPDWLDAPETMNFSIAIRAQILFTTFIVLFILVARDRWRG